MFILRAELEHLAIVSWAVPRERVASMLPDALEPNPIDEDGKWALVSMATMWDTTRGQTYTQVNERTYVRKKDGTGEGAYFWKSHADTAQADLFRWLLGIPEFHDDVRVTVAKSGKYTCTLEGRPVLELRTTQQGKTKKKAGMTDPHIQRAWDISKNPLIGYTLDWGVLCQTPVRHDTIIGRQVWLESVDPTFMVPSLVIEPGDPPIFVCYQEHTPFYIALPPRPVAGCWSLLSRFFNPWRI